MKFFNKILRNEDGATAIEYGLIAALIAVAAIGALQGLGSQLSTTFSDAETAMANAGGSGSGSGGSGSGSAGSGA